jgi:hypothetical protein
VSCSENITPVIQSALIIQSALVSYWGSDDPDEATATLLHKLEENPPDRTFLLTVLRAQIELGLNDEFGALFAVEDRDDDLMARAGMVRER